MKGREQGGGVMTRKSVWDTCDSEADYTALIARKSQPDSRGRYHCTVCGRFSDAPDPTMNNGEPRCEDHDFCYAGGTMTRSEYINELSYAEDW